MRIKNHKVRSRIDSKANRTLTGDGVPQASQGKNGDLTLRLVDGTVKLYGKFRGKWYGVNLS